MSSEGWDEWPYGPASQQVGGEWTWSEESLVLRVPSVVVPVEHNYLINPEHPDVGELEFGEPRPFDPAPGCQPNEPLCRDFRMTGFLHVGNLRLPAGEFSQVCARKGPSKAVLELGFRG